MPTEINKTTIEDAKLAVEGKLTREELKAAEISYSDGRVQVTDTRARGLVIRGGPKGLRWEFRKQIGGNARRLVLGAIDSWSVKDARSIANAADAYSTTFGIMVDEAWLQAYLVETGKIDRPAPEQDLSAAAFPTYAEAMEEYLDNAAGRLSKDTVAGYRGFLQHRLMTALNKRRLPTITLDDVREIVIAVHAGGDEPTAEHIASAVRPMWTFLREPGRRKQYGELQNMSDLKAPDRTYSDTDDDYEEEDDPWSAGYVPPISELGRIIAVARSGILNPVPAGAIELLCWTVQRRSTIARARVWDFEPLPDGKTGLWHVPSPTRKGIRKGKKAKPHTIPLPEPIWSFVVRAMAVAEANHKDKDKKLVYLFPAARARRAGGVKRHISPYTLGHYFVDIPGCAATPQDVRRTMGTHGEEALNFSRVDTGTILDHTESRKVSERITSRTFGAGTDSVTGVHYSLHKGLHHTWPVMRTWCAAIEAAIADETAKLESIEELARGWGNPNYRSDAGMLIPTGVMSHQELADEEGAVQRKIVRLGGEYTLEELDEEV